MCSMKPYLLSALLVMCSETVFGLDVAIHAEMKGNDSSKLIISTNLPDKSKGRTTIYNDSIGYHDIETEVSAGCFIAVDPGTNIILHPGTYMLEVSLAPAQFQPPAVRSVIGNRGEMLQGSFVRKGMQGKRVFYKTEIIVQ